TLNQMIEFVRLHNIKEVWAATVRNLLRIKHHILMLQNNSYLCSCLSIIQYEEPFLVADKFTLDMMTLPNNSSVPYLYLFKENRADFCEENLMTLDQRIIYGKLHGIYKKALNKALQNKSRSQELIDLLQGFAEDGDNDDSLDSDEGQESDDKENINP
ncbi:16148_t:CDS:2, partial [Racocetra persica]